MIIILQTLRRRALCYYVYVSTVGKKTNQIYLKNRRNDDIQNLLLDE